MTLLRTVAAVWQQETVAQSAQAVHELGAELHKRLGTFAGHLAKLGRSLDGAVGSYNEAVGSFESPRARPGATPRGARCRGDRSTSPAQIERQTRSVGGRTEHEAAVARAAA